MFFKDDELVVISEKVHGSNMRASNLPRYNKTFLGQTKEFNSLAKLNFL